MSKAISAKEPVTDPKAALEKSSAPEKEDATNPVEGQLTPEQTEELKKLETAIETGFGGFVEVGRALKAIDDNKLYKNTGEDFKTYCKTRWRISNKYAYRLIHASEFVDKLKSLNGMGDCRALPTNESQVRPIVEKLNRGKWAKTWRQVLEACEGKVITAAEVSKVVQEVLGTPKATKPKHPPETKPEGKTESNKTLDAVGNLVRETRSKTEGVSLEFYKETLDKIWGLLEPELKPA